MNDVNYISIEDIQEDTSISRNVDPSLLVPYIRSSEKKYVTKVLGTALDSELKNAITGNTLSGVNYTLVQNYIKPFCAWAALNDAFAFQAFRITPKGIFRPIDANSEAPQVADLNWFKQAIKDNQTLYRQELIDYLEANTTLYPNYRSCTKANEGSKYSNGIYLGKYDR